MDPVNLKVLDLSHHNEGPRGPIDFDAIRAFGVRGVILKATQGTGYIDPTYAERRQAAAAAGLLVGAYHFATGEDPAAQVEHFVSAAEPDAGLLMALDHEPNPPSHGGNLDLAGAQAFLAALRDKIGRVPVIYSGNLIKEQTAADDSLNDFFGDIRLWLCQYGPRAKLPDPWEDYWLWQFSGDGIANRDITVPGLVHGDRVDMNSFAGSDDDLAKSWA